MSPVVRVGVRAAAEAVLDRLPRRVELDLSELLAAARLAGDLPLPIHPQPGPEDRITARLAGGSTTARDVLAAAEARAADPGGALDDLTGRGLVADGRLDADLVAALTVLGAGRLAAVLDVALGRRDGDLHLRVWFGGAPGRLVQLSTGDGQRYELAWFAPELWASQVTRAIEAAPQGGPPAPLPDYVSIPSELLAAATKAHRERRPDLLPALVATGAGEVRAGEPGLVRTLDADQTLGVLHTLGARCRGRLRLALGQRVEPGRDRTGEGPAVASWLLFDDGWHELRPGRDATTVLRRREAPDLGRLSQPWVERLAGPGHSGGRNQGGR